MSRRLEFFFDYGSPYSYVANAQLPALVARTGATLVYRPMLLGGVFKATGNRSPAAEPIEPKRRYGGVTLLRYAAEAGVAFRPNPHFPIDTLFVMRCAVAAQHAKVFDAFHARVYPAFWAEGENLGDRDVFARVLAGAGLDAAKLFEGALQPDVKTELRATTEEAVARGAFGAPTFFVGDELFFGSDHLRFAAKALEAQPRAADPRAPR
ncbi:MAG TPA: 2-hydroxychromene-2-carboxylate isomerase [Myxococcota bacterium]|nr:2-hydroxychromene-2-carboxylate isomerase [Myxococcota bacterium]